MGQRVSSWAGVVVVMVALAGVVGWPTAGGAQTVTGQARAVQATVLGGLGSLGSTTVLSDTGPLESSDDARQASQVTGAVPSLLSAGVLHATTIGWPDRAIAEASLAALDLSVAGNGISAGFVMARAAAGLGVVGGGDTTIDALAINGVPITVTGQPNQTILIVGGRIVINEQRPLVPSGMTVNALHIVVDGVADVVIASATAGI
jgi:hypothetical protein